MKRIWVASSAAVVGLILGVASPGALADDRTKKADLQQELDIRTELQNSSALKDNDIDVTVDDGIAVLEGTVDSKREKKEATKRAHVEGVLGVNNRLEVRGAGK
jgi:osmotically-inducible protein OsmY